MRILWGSVVVSAILSIIAASAADVWLSERIALFGSFMGLQYALNPGIAWGIRLPAGVQEGLIMMALITVGYLAWQSCKQVSGIRHTVVRMRQMAYGMILGGGAANVVDRLRDGFVTDYMQVGTFPIFNVADSFVSIGVGLLLIEVLLLKRDKE